MGTYYGHVRLSSSFLLLHSDWLEVIRSSAKSCGNFCEVVMAIDGKRFKRDCDRRDAFKLHFRYYLNQAWSLPSPEIPDGHYHSDVRNVMLFFYAILLSSLISLGAKYEEEVVPRRSVESRERKWKECEIQLKFRVPLNFFKKWKNDEKAREDLGSDHPEPLLASLIQFGFNLGDLD